MNEKSQQKLSPYRWVVLACVCGVCFMANYMQYQVSVWGVVVMEGLGIQVAELQTLMLMPMVAAIFLAIPAGGLADRFGVKKIVCVGLSLATVAGFLRVLCISSFPMQMVSMLGLGFGMACLNANMPKILGTWFKDKMTFAVGVFYAVSCIAIVCAQSVSVMFGGLHTTYMVAAVGLLVVCVCWFAFAKNHPVGEEVPESEPVTKYLGAVVKNKNVWLIAATYALTMASTTGLGTIFPTIMQVARGYSMELAGALSAVGTIGSFFACIIGPVYVQKRGKNKPFLIVTTLAGAITMAAIWWVQLGASLWALMVVNAFLTACSGPIIESMVFQLPDVGAKYAGSAGGIVTTVGLASSYVIPIAISAVLGENFMALMMAYAVVFALSALTVALLPETGWKKASKGAPAASE